MVTFEESMEAIDIAISQHAHRWTLKARPDIDYDDISQQLRIHIHKKWMKWDQSRELAPWLHRIIKNQLINLLRNLYTGMTRPCLRCPQSRGEDLCVIYNTQCDKCPLFAKWEKTKKKKFNVNLPVSIENHANVMSETPNQDIDFNRAIPILNQRLKLVLKAYEWQFYDLMYIQNLSEKEIVKIMDFKSTEKKTNRFKRMLQIKKSVMDQAKEILREHGIEN